MSHAPLDSSFPDTANMNRNSQPSSEELPNPITEVHEGKAILQEKRLIELFGYDQETISSMLGIYMESQAKLIESLANALAINPDVKLICRLAHTIKGCASNFGVDALSELAGKMEEDCNAMERQTADR